MEQKEQLFEQLFVQYRQQVYRLCYSYTRSETLAEDLVQECFSKVWIHLSDFQQRSEIGTWIYRIAANTCLMQLRQSKKNQIEYRESLQEQVLEETSDEIEERSAALFRAINQLEETDRLIISMVMENLPQKQIAEIMGISENNVYVKVHRIKKQLKSLILK